MARPSPPQVSRSRNGVSPGTISRNAARYGVYPILQPVFWQLHTSNIWYPPSYWPLFLLLILHCHPLFPIHATICGLGLLLASAFGVYLILFVPFRPPRSSTSPARLPPSYLLSSLSRSLPSSPSNRTSQSQSKTDHWCYTRTYLNDSQGWAGRAEKATPGSERSAGCFRAFQLVSSSFASTKMTTSRKKFTSMKPINAIFSDITMAFGIHSRLERLPFPWIFLRWGNQCKSFSGSLFLLYVKLWAWSLEECTDCKNMREIAYYFLLISSTECQSHFLQKRIRDLSWSQNITLI